MQDYGDQGSSHGAIARPWLIESLKPVAIHWLFCELYILCDLCVLCG
jgi:hypothetical protein